MFVCGQRQKDFDYVVDMDANINMNKEQEKSLKFVDRKLKLDLVDRVITQTLNIDIKKCNILKDYDMDANVSTISRMNKLITSNQ